MKNTRSASDVTYQLASQTCEVPLSQLRYDHNLNISVDHNITIGSIAGIVRATRERTGRALGVIWVDAHADIDTPETRASGSIHGTPVAFLTGLVRREHHNIFGWIEKGHLIETSQIVHIGLGDVDHNEARLLKEHNIANLSMQDIKRHARPSSWLILCLLCVS